MLRGFSTAILILLITSGCAAVLVPQSWGLAQFEVQPPLGELQVAVVPAEERNERDRSSPDAMVTEEVLPPPAISAERVAVAEPGTPATMVRIYYGTNRPVSGEPAGNRYGTCDVSIPARHQFGELERPSLWRLEFRESAARHVLLKSVTPLASDVCLDQLRSDLSATSSPEIFVFIHGFNVTFAEAAMRTAQMAFDLKFR